MCPFFIDDFYSNACGRSVARWMAVGVGTGQPEREGCGGRRVPDTPGKCAWFWKSKGFTMLTTLIVVEVGRTGAEFAQSGYASTIPSIRRIRHRFYVIRAK